MVVEVLHTGLAFDAVCHVVGGPSLASHAEVIFALDRRILFWFYSRVKEYGQCVENVNEENDESVQVSCDCAELVVLALRGDWLENDD
jgi:hypothetical protein